MRHTDNPTEALEALRTKRNIFLTGSAGSGKTTTIRHYLKESATNVAMCATTGIAALQAGGETIHRFLKLGIASRPEEARNIIRKWNTVKRSPKYWDRQRWRMIRDLDTLVIDEVSMLRRDTLELIDKVLREVRRKPGPYGDVRMILTGDMCQLPPVVTEEDLEHWPDLQEPFPFQSESWDDADFDAINLTCNFRQGEGEFLNALAELRFGIVSDKTDAMMKSRVNARIRGQVRPLALYTTNREVERENLKKLSQLTRRKFTSQATYTGKEFDIAALKKDCVAEDQLHYCIGAQIMMLINDKKDQWANGSMGIVTDIKKDHVKIALSGGTEVEVDKHTWERTVPIMEGDKLEYKTSGTMTQFPFKLAYASTIHKSQGMTLDMATIDLPSTFAPGQGYVALSRVRTLEGLSLQAWSRDSVFADPQVLKFYEAEKART